MVNNMHGLYTINFMRDLEIDGSILIYTNDGGGGHRQAANAEEREFWSQQKNYENSNSVELKGSVKTIDIVRGSYPPIFRKIMHIIMTSSWNKAKKNGDLEAQEKLINGKILGVAKPIIADFILFIPVFFTTFFRITFNKNITRIIDTQPVATSAIIKSVRLVNFIFNRNIKVTKVMTDLPTEGAIHFSRPIKRLSEKDKAVFEVVTTNPLRLDENESEQDWWKRVFGLNFDPDNPENSQVKYGEFPLRPAFLKWKNVPADERQNYLNVKVNNDEEFQFINELMGDNLDKNEVAYGSDPTKTKNVVSIPMDPEKDVVGMITIGSQAAKKTKEYADDFIEMVKDLPDDRKYILYVGCGRHNPGKDTLFKEVYELVKEKELPEHIKVIPLGFQDDDEFAPMMHHMTFGIAGTGGLTTMEMVRTAKGKIYLHSEYNVEETNVENSNDDRFNEVICDDKQRMLLNGFAVWEKWNALYQVKEKQAEIVLPGNQFNQALTKLLNPGEVYDDVYVAKANLMNQLIDKIMKEKAKAGPGNFYFSTLA